MKEKWTDERLDDLNDKVGEGFRRVDADIRGLRSEMNERFGRLEDQMNARFERVDARFDAMQRLMIQGGAVIVAALIGVIATLIGVSVV
jgi:hypothetical protein